MTELLTLSEVLKALTEIKEKYGDLPIFLEKRGFVLPTSIESVSVGESLTDPEKSVVYIYCN